MKISVLASGSKGNCTLIQTKNTNILIDAGMSNLYMEKHLISLGVNPDLIDSVFITHTHVDHIAGLKVFIKKHNPIVYLTEKMYKELKDILNQYVILEDKIFINDLTIEYFKTSHDTEDSVGYVVSDNESSVVYVTDTGYINSKYFDMLSNKDLYVFESNHDVQLLMDNPNYPYQTKQRILSDKGHLSNKDSSYYLSKLVGDKTKHIILAHLSEQNNDPNLALETLKNKINSNITVEIANQNEMTELIEV